MIQSTVDMLRSMKMTAMASELERQTGDAAYRELSMEERLSLIVNAEWNRRQNNKINRLINAARFAQPSATMEGIEYFEDRKLDKPLLLRLSTCKYIESGHHIILKGASGNGKTYLACALGNAACRNLKTVRYCAATRFNQNRRHNTIREISFGEYKRFPGAELRETVIVKTPVH